MSMKSEETIFSKIIRREIPADIVYEDAHCLCFKDINPVAPVHVLLIPKRCIPRLADAVASDQDILGELMAKVPVIAKKLGVEDAFRVVINSGAGACQSVFHLHIHIIAGRALGWPPG
jgi:histidine triad (HIT) family protein